MFVCPVPKISLVVMKWRRASHHGRFTLWHNGNLRSGDFFFLAGEFDFSKLFKDERFGRFSKHRSIVDLQQTLEITFCLLFIQQTFKR